MTYYKFTACTPLDNSTTTYYLASRTSLPEDELVMICAEYAGFNADSFENRIADSPEEALRMYYESSECFWSKITKKEYEKNTGFVQFTN